MLGCNTLTQIIQKLKPNVSKSKLVIVHGEFSTRELNCNKLPEFMSVKKFRLNPKQIHSTIKLENILHVQIMLDLKFDEDFISKFDLKNKTPNIETIEIFQFGGNYYPYAPVIPSYNPKISISLLNQLQEMGFQKLVIDGLRWDDLSNDDEALATNENIKVCD